MKSYAVHYKNKYPYGNVKWDDSSLDVYGADGAPLVSLRKNGAGQVVDVSEEHGCRDRHDLAPIPKDARVHKVCPKGNIVLDDEAAHRIEARKQFMGEDGRVKSCHEIGPKAFDEKQRLVK